MDLHCWTTGAWHCGVFPDLWADIVTVGGIECRCDNSHSFCLSSHPGRNLVQIFLHNSEQFWDIRKKHFPQGVALRSAPRRRGAELIARPVAMGDHTSWLAAGAVASWTSVSLEGTC